MIPQNTTVITKEMINQFDLEHIEMQNEFERYNSWFNPIQFQFIGALGKLKLLTKKMGQIQSLYEYYKFVQKSIKKPGKVEYRLTCRKTDISHKLKTGLATISTLTLPYQFHILDKIFQFPTQPRSFNQI